MQPTITTTNKPKPYTDYQQAQNAARQVFFHTSGHGLGMKFMRVDWEPMPGFPNEFGLANVRQWLSEHTHIADGVDTDSAPYKLPSMQALSNKAWHVTAPNPVFKLDAPNVFEAQGVYWQNRWLDSGADASSYADATEQAVAEACAPFLSLVSDCLGGDAERVQFFVDWLRVAMQPRKRKAPVAMYTYGAHGGFKGTVLECIREAFGETNVSVVKTDSELTDMNVGQLFESRLVAVEEIRPNSHDGSAVYTNIKGLVASDGGKARRKSASFTYESTPAMLWMQGNHAPPFLEEGDRRFWVVKWEVEGLTDNTNPEVSKRKREIRDGIMEWLYGGGAEALRAYLTYFEPSQRLADAPHTHERDMAISGNTSMASRTIQALIDSDDFASKVLFTHASLPLGRLREQGKYALEEAGLRWVTLTEIHGPDAKDPKLDMETSKGKKVSLVRGKNAGVYLRHGWAVRKVSNKWSLVGPDGQAEELTHDNCQIDELAIDVAF